MNTHLIYPKIVFFFTLFITSQLSAQTTTPCTKYEVISTNNNCGCAEYLFRPYGLFMEANNPCGLEYFKPDTVVFEIRNDSTAAIRGVFRTFEDWRPIRVDITLAKVATGAPRLDLCLINSPATVANQWRYFGEMSGTIQVDGAAPLNVSSRDGNFQMGVGANAQNTDMLGGSGFFTLSNGKRGGFGFNLINPTAGSCILSNPCAADATPPAFSNCPTNINLTASGTTAIANWTAPTATDNCGTPSVSSNFSLGLAFPIGTTTVVYTAKDAKNNTAECRFNVVVSLLDPCATDATPPVFSNCPTNINLTTSGTTAIANWTAPTVTDNCGTPSVSSNFSSGVAFPIGITTVVYTAKDAKNNVSECRFNITVTKHNATAGTCTNYMVGNTNNICGCPTTQWVPYSLFIERAGGCGDYYVADSVTFQINADSSARLRGIFRTSAWRPVLLDVQWSKTTQKSPRFSACANDTMASQDWRFFGTAQGNIQFDDKHSLNVSNQGLLQVGTGANEQNRDLFGAGGTIILSDGRVVKINVVLKNPLSETCPAACVNDAVAPRIVKCPENMTQLTVQTPVAITWAAPSVRDDCSSPTLSSTHSSGSLFPAGETTVVYTARDVSGNESQCSFKINIKQVAAGNLCTSFDVENTNDACGCAASQWKPYALRIGANNCGDYYKADSVVFLINGDSSARLQGRFRSDTWQPIIVDVRFEKTASRTARFELCQTDNPLAAQWRYFGNMSGSIKVGDAAPMAVQTSSLLQIGEGANGQNPTLMGGSVNFSLPTGISASFNLVLVNQQQFACSEDSCAFDIVLPTITQCPKDTTIITSQTSAVARWIAPTASDNCTANPILSSNFTSGQNFTSGSTVVIYTARDAAGNSSQCRFTITVVQNLCLVDTVAPVLHNCPVNRIVTTTVNSTPVIWTSPTATDNCTSPSISSNFPSGSFFSVGSTTIIITARDSSGNISRCQFVITVEKTTSVEDLNAPFTGMKIAPNPAIDQINLQLNSRIADETRLEVSNALGQTVLQQKVSMRIGENILPIDISSLSKGVYYLIIRNAQGAIPKPIRFMKI